MGHWLRMGFAEGTLLKMKVPKFVTDVWEYMQSEVDAVVPYLPKWLADMVADMGLDLALDFTEAVTRSYTGKHFYDEFQGMADATGADYQTIVRLHMIAGLTQGKCSMFGMWGKALAPGYDLLQLRSLDWDMEGPFRDYAAVTVYHPTDGHPFMNIGMSLFIGGLTGFSSTGLAISEIGVAYPDNTFGSESRIGLPFIFLLRDILQFDSTVDDSINRMANAKRTCDLILGVGDGKLKEFRGFQYSSSVLDVFDDQNMRPFNQTWHPRITDTVYWGMDWLCTGYNLVLGQQIQKYYGQWTPELAVKYISSVEKSGDNHVAFYDFTNQKVYVAFAAPHATGGPKEAYARQYTVLDAKALFNENRP